MYQKVDFTLFQIFLILSDPKIAIWFNQFVSSEILYVGQDEIIWKNLLFWELLNHQKKKSHLRPGVELYGHFSSQNSKHRWLESCACDNSRLLSINNTCHFCFTGAVTYCSKWLSTQGPACSPRLHFSSIPNLKGPSSIRPATIATRPWLWVRRPHRSSLPAARKPEVPARASVRYVGERGLCCAGPWAPRGTAGSRAVRKAWLSSAFLTHAPQLRKSESRAVCEGNE